MNGGGARRIVIAGGRGLVGRALAAKLEGEGHAVTVLTRGAPRAARERRWSPGVVDPAYFVGADAVVQLTGAPISVRWTAARRAEIRASRVDATAALVRSFENCRPRPQALVAASAVGIYGDRGDEWLEESSPAGTGFLAALAQDWERESLAAENFGVRVVPLRFGLVLDGTGGVLGRLAPLFRLGLGGRVGGGRQWWSWIAIDDLTDVIARALFDPALRGPINAVVTEPVRAEEFARALGRAVSRPAWLPAPAAMLRLAFGEMADEVLLASQRVRPGRLIAAGWSPREPDLERALRHALAAGPAA